MKSKTILMAGLAMAVALTAGRVTAGQIRYTTTGLGTIGITNAPGQGPNELRFIQNANLSFSVVGDTANFTDQDYMGASGVRLISAGAPMVGASGIFNVVEHNLGNNSFVNVFHTAFNNPNVPVAGPDPGETQLFAAGFGVYGGAYTYGSIIGSAVDLGPGFGGAGLSGWDGLSPLAATPVTPLGSDSPEIYLATGAIWHLNNLHDLTFTATALGGSADAPLVALGPTAPDGGFAFNFSATDGVPVYIDPEVAVGYDYAVGAGPLIATAIFPTIGASSYNIYALNDLNTLLFSGVTGGQKIDFRTLAGYENGIAGFSLRGVDVGAGLDPANDQAFVTALTFVGQGDVSLTQTPFNQTVGVPEPTTWAMLLTGFALLGGALRRRRVTLAA